MNDKAGSRQARRGTARLAAAALATVGLLAAACGAGQAGYAAEAAALEAAGGPASPAPVRIDGLPVEADVQGGGALAAPPRPVVVADPGGAPTPATVSGAPSPAPGGTPAQARPTTPAGTPAQARPTTLAGTPAQTRPTTPTATPTVPPAATPSATAPTIPPTATPSATATPGTPTRSLADALTDAIRALQGTPTPEPTPAHGAPDCRRVKCVALTFDDGPGPYTATLLRHLAARKARATFFVVGQNVVAHPDLVRRAAAAGHEIGGHTWSHRDLTTLRAASIRSDLARTAKAIKAVTGVAPTLMRPPYGAQNARVRKHAKQPMIMWSVDTLDWRYRNSARVARVAVKQARPGGIILFHDIHPTTVKAIPRVLKKLSARGYHFVTVSELLGTAPGGLVYRGPRP
ncbi:polysaccharide deacetylase family protein [Nonomuraea muscovyensis]|uniref:polysaccharide deacetylase family protein n=1 Tax=Nonomuraea muscovyensis TaxID=1124761 RepID=UPI0033E0280F